MHRRYGRLVIKFLPFIEIGIKGESISRAGYDRHYSHPVERHRFKGRDGCLRQEDFSTAHRQAMPQRIG